MPHKKHTATPLPGPHLCSQVGANVTELMRAAMKEMCNRRGGRLSLVEIDHVFDLVQNSTELFSVFQHAYAKCVGLKNSPNFSDVDADVVTRFVVGAFCRDVVSHVFEPQIKLRGSHWKHAFFEGLTAFLESDIDPELPQKLFDAYRKLAMRLGGSLTPVSILHCEDVVSAFGRAIATLRAEIARDTETLERLELRINDIISHEFNLSGPAPEKLNNMTGMAFVNGISVRSDHNPFRSLVLDATVAA